ncbi:hypothetical protein [Halorussus lipolyticus]|uniref:hypothetical protein n=1 Tax=Halorussus lipolyticus TaxID=3034024 RepID=UPI0023E8DAD3|nr:hypothetical protein [Halorussus sp. DT80]
MCGFDNRYRSGVGDRDRGISGNRARRKIEASSVAPSGDGTAFDRMVGGAVQVGRVGVR